MAMDPLDAPDPVLMFTLPLELVPVATVPDVIVIEPQSKKNSSSSGDKAHHLSNIVHSGALDSGSVEFIPSGLPILAGPTSLVMHIDPKLGPVMVQLIVVMQLHT